MIADHNYEFLCRKWQFKFNNFWFLMIVYGSYVKIITMIFNDSLFKNLLF